MFKIKNILKVFFAKKILTKPLRNKLVILDSISEDLFKVQLKKFKFDTLDLRLKKINLYVLFALLLKLKKINIFNYTIEYLDISKPKIVLTLNHNLVLFYKLKSYFPQTKFLSIQNGILSKPSLDLLKKNKDMQADYFMTFGKKVSQEYKKFFNSKYIELGSLRNNFIKKKKINKLRKSILFISSGFEGRENKKYHTIANVNIISQKNFFEKEAIILKNIHQYCQVNNYKLEILEKFWRKDDREYKYYKTILNNKKFVYHRKNKQKSDAYETSDNVLATFSTFSALGLELIARGNRVGICNYRKSLNEALDTFYPLLMNKKGKFWTNYYNYNEIKRVLDFIINAEQIMWRNQVSKIKTNLMSFNPKNTKLIKIIQKYY